MVDNGITSIPKLIFSSFPPCVTGTRDMTLFPDIFSNAQNGSKVADPSGEAYTYPADKQGYVLYGHDISADGAPQPTVNYLTYDETVYCYTADADGSVTQYETDGTQTTP